MTVLSTRRIVMTRLRRLVLSLSAVAFLFVTFGHFVQHHVDIANPAAAAAVTMVPADTPTDAGDAGKIAHAAHCHTCSTVAIDVSYDVGLMRALSAVPEQVALPLTAVADIADGPPPRS